ncbi:quinone oxidoreductase family protein [Pleomorphomonas oryzae]|uniref:quinone oxidoreductase family protein n=1 Tax=Pleomorphomonas oryzae TaxID=261934 RepID=UPI0003FA9E8A|nr:quinone oxidoreductase [Pleomorphomonas oryzae]
MVKAIVVRQTGGPEVMSLEEVEVGAPGPGEVRLKHTAIGVNFIDTYYRKGLYPAPAGLPFIPGAEAVGIVEKVGEGVVQFRPGDRVAYAGSVGAYAEARLISAQKLVRIPDDIDGFTVAASLLKGMTVQYLLRQTFKVTRDHTVLFHAGAGGVGQIAGQWLKSLGATSIATVGSEEKAEIARSCGYTHVINYRTEDFVARVAEITGGAKCDVVYDSVGKDTFPASLDCLKPRGLFASFGNSSGPVAEFNLGILSQKGSLYVTRPTLGHYTATRGDLDACAEDLFEQIRNDVVKINVGQKFKLADAVACHKAMEARETVGSTLLTV